MRRSMNGTRSNSPASSKQSGGTMTRRSTLSEEQNGKGERTMGKDEEHQALPGAGPVTARLKMLEKRYAQVLEMQAKFSILDKWMQQQFGVKLFPASTVNMEKFAEGNPEDAENPFYAVYMVIQRVKFLEEKVKTLEARGHDEFQELKPTSNYSSAHAFRKLRGGKAGGGVKRPYNASPSTTPKKAKLMPRPVVPPSSNYPFKPSVKILPKDPNAPSPIKKEKDAADLPKDSSPTKAKDTVKIVEIKQEVDDTQDDKQQSDGAEPISDSNAVMEEGAPKNADVVVEEKSDKKEESTLGAEEKEKEATGSEKPGTADDGKAAEGMLTPKVEVPDDDDAPVSLEEESGTADKDGEDMGTEELKPATEEMGSPPEDIPVLEDATAADEGMEIGSDQDEEDMEVEQKPLVEEEAGGGGDISGSEASVSSMTSSSGRPRLSTRRQAAVAAAASASGKSTEEEKPVMYTTRGRRHTVPRRYAEFTGHDNVVSILKSQQRAEKSAAAAAGSSKGGRRQTTASSKLQDTPPKIKKMVKGTKTPSPKKSNLLHLDSDDGEPGPSSGKKKTGSGSTEKPACVDALVARVMAREVDSDGMVVLSESYPNIFVNQQQLITVVVRSNGKSTRLTRKMTTLVFEDSVLASASPFGTKYYKDRLPPEPLEAMVDFIADSGFEPHYSKKKIYMIVGQVCNEARAGRVSKKFMSPMDAAAGGSQQTGQREEPGSPDIGSSSSETPQSSLSTSQ